MKRILSALILGLVLGSQIIGLAQIGGGGTTGGGAAITITNNPGGSNTQVQFNDSNAFGGNSALVFNKGTGTLTATNVTVTGTCTGCGGGGLAFPVSVVSPGAAGTYTLANSGFVVVDGMGEEVWRIWGTDPDTANDYNAGNLYIGKEAGGSQPTDNMSAGYFNTGVGFEALNGITLGTQNSAFGYYSLNVNSTGAFNAAYGSYSLAVNTTGIGNAAFGYDALFSSVTANDNAAFGQDALFATTAAGNTGVGSFVLQYNTTGTYNTGIGWGAGETAANTNANHQSITDIDMVFVGRNASRLASGGLTNGIAIGADATVLASNHAVIGNVSVTDAYFGSETAAAKIHAAGMFGMGVTACTAGLHAAVTLTTDDTGAIIFTRGSCS